jgi:hypothetical protein
VNHTIPHADQLIDRVVASTTGLFDLAGIYPCRSRTTSGASTGSTPDLPVVGEP